MTENRFEAQNFTTASVAINRLAAFARGLGETNHG